MPGAMAKCSLPAGSTAFHPALAPNLVSLVIDPDGQGIEMCEYVRGGPAWGGAYR